MIHLSALTIIWRPTLGSLRFFLAGMVVFHHIAHFPFIGQHAVFIFFVISGYLMTLVMHKSYGYSVSGCARFWTNRILRLYPTYFVILSVSIIVFLIIPKEISREFREFMFLPESISNWAQNITMVYASWFPNSISPRISPATWALTVELFYYLMISFGVSFNRLSTWIWFCISACYTISVLALQFDFKWSYFALPAGSLSFSIGALIYHYKQELKNTLLPYAKTILWTGFISLLLIFVLRRFSQL